MLVPGGSAEGAPIPGEKTSSHYPKVIGSEENTGDEKECNSRGEKDSVSEGHGHGNQKLGLQGIVEHEGHQSDEGSD